VLGFYLSSLGGYIVVFEVSLSLFAYAGCTAAVLTNGVASCCFHTGPKHAYVSVHACMPAHTHTHTQVATTTQRVTSGKSAIHGWGAFAKAHHKAGEMVIEYAGVCVYWVCAHMGAPLEYSMLGRI